MRAMRPRPALAWIGLCLLSVPLVRLAWSRSPEPPLPPPAALPRHTVWNEASQPRSPSRAALRRALRFRLQAHVAVNQDREALETWDPSLNTGADQEPLRRQLLAADRTGDLHRAREHARRALALAQTPDEIYLASLWSSMLDHDAGDHDTELEHARRLISLRPHDPTALAVLRRATHSCRARPTAHPPAARRP